MFICIRLHELKFQTVVFECQNLGRAGRAINPIQSKLIWNMFYVVTPSYDTL